MMGGWRNALRTPFCTRTSLHAGYSHPRHPAHALHRLQDPTSGLDVVEAPRPTPGQGEVLVRITLRPVNPADIFSLQVRHAAPAAPAAAARTRRVPLRVLCAVVGMQAALASSSLIWFAVPQFGPYFLVHALNLTTSDPPMFAGRVPWLPPPVLPSCPRPGG